MVEAKQEGTWEPEAEPVPQLQTSISFLKFSFFGQVACGIDLSAQDVNIRGGYT